MANMNCSLPEGEAFDLIPGEDVLAPFSAPKFLGDTREEMKNFIRLQMSNKRKVAVVTSGGTAVPLENKTVRFIDNFSTGTRGSAAAEYLLEAGYAVIFIHRRKTLMPFRRHLDKTSTKGLTLLDMFRLHSNKDGSTDISVDQSHIPELASVLEWYQLVKDRQMLLCVQFVTLCDYLHYLRVAAEAIHPLGHHGMVFLAAAVADFYVPDYALPEHKIQSADGPPVIHLRQVPKMLGHLSQEWAQEAFIVSFKLETDHSLLIKKARAALHKYQHQVVIANLLENLRTKLEIITSDDQCILELDQAEIDEGKELEEKLIADLTQRHDAFATDKE